MAWEALQKEKSEFLKDFLQGSESFCKSDSPAGFYPGERVKEQVGPHWKVKPRPSEFVLKFFIDPPDKILGI